jgi:hypothetical protein
MFRPLLLTLFGIASILTTTTAAPAAIFWGFEEGDFGTYWFNLSPGPDRAPDIMIFTGTAEGGYKARSGSYFLTTANYGREDYHDPLIARSVPFVLDGGAPLTFYYAGGKSDSDARFPNVVAPPLGTGPIPIDVMGIALRDYYTGERVLSTRFTSGNAGFYTLITWSQAVLAPFVGRVFTLDIYDTYGGEGHGWAHFAVDDITIPGHLPEPAAAASALVCGMLLLSRRRA